MKPRAILCLWALAACAMPTTQDPQKSVKPGSWVEAKGRIDNGKPLVTEVNVIERAPDDKPDKFELLAPVTKASPTELELIGLKLLADETTEYENPDKKQIDPFVAAPGDWVRIKARNRDNSLRARTVRQSDAKGAFKLTGEFRTLDEENDVVDIAGIRLPASQDAEVGIAGKRDSDDPLSLFLADDQKGVPFTIEAAKNLRLGGQISANPEWQDDYDLSNTSRKDRNKLSYGGKLDALWLLGESGSYAMFEISFGRNETTRQSSSTDTFTYAEQFEVTRALGSFRLTDELQLITGRQDFYETRRFLYDELLDGVRLMSNHGPLEMEVGAATGRAVAAENNATEDTQLLEGNVRYQLGKEWTASAYVLKRFDATVEDHEPFLYGLRSLDRPRYGLGHWVELGGALGHSTFLADPNNSATRFESDLLGFAFDVGATWTFDAPGRPYLAAGYAMGTGAGINAKKQGYRQSGYNDNNGKMGGVTSIRYYGELFRPELSNVGIATLAGTVRPFDDSAITLLWHSYIQDTPTTYSPSSDLRTTTNGISPSLGYEIDLVFGYRPRPGMTLEFTAGRFVPGAAYDSKDPANKLEFTFRFGF